MGLKYLNRKVRMNRWVGCLPPDVDGIRTQTSGFVTWPLNHSTEALCSWWYFKARLSVKTHWFNIYFFLSLIYLFLLFIYSFIHFFFQVRLTQPCPWYGECALFSMCSSSFVADISHEPALSFINTVAVSRFVLSRCVCKISSNAQSKYSYVFGSLWSESPLLIFHGERFRNIYSRKHIIKYCSPS